MTKFYIRTYNEFEFDVPSMFNEITLGDPYLESFFDVEWYKSIYVMSPRFQDSGTGQPIQDQSFGSPEPSSHFEITRTTAQGNFGRITLSLGDPNSVLELSAIEFPGLGGGWFNTINWHNSGYQDPFGDYNLFKNQVCQQIKQAAGQDSDLAIFNNWNVFFYKTSLTNILVWYWAGNDPDADEIIEVL